MLVRLLGPIDVLVAGSARPVNGVRRKAVLAVLGLAAGEVVSTDRLVDVVWGEQAAEVRLNTLQSHVSYLRRVLGNTGAIVARGAGYALDRGLVSTDLQVATRLIEESQREPDPTRRLEPLRAALELWRGRPMDDVSGITWLDHEAERVTTLRLDAIQCLIDARLALGEHVGLVPELTELVQLHPHREDLCGQLMLALYRAGRQADALAVYQRLRRALAEDLGIDPSAELRSLEAAVLRQDQTIAAPVAAEPPPAVPDRTTHPLPLDTGAFTGRVAETSALIGRVVAADDERRPVLLIHAIDGMPGVGKTTLAVHVAHKLADRYPDPPVFVDLHGHAEDRPPADPGDVLAALLCADGINPRHLPDDVTSRSALWQRRLVGRRLLLVLDDAASSAQVAPLLPASPDCLVLVTSRRYLGDLPGDVVALPLDVLAPDEAAEMFVRLAPGAAADPSGVAELVAACGHLPLAISLLARLLVRHRTWTVRDLLTETRTRLMRLTAEHRTVAAAFDLSYRHLDAERQHFFRRLGRHPGTTIDGYAAAAVADVPHAAAAAHLAALHADNLLAEAGYHRYTMHELIRGYTRALETHDPAEELTAATGRLLAYYARTAAAAAARLTRLTSTHEHRPDRDGPPLRDPTEALAWLRAERDTLLACLAGGGPDDARQVVGIAAGLVEVLHRDGPWSRMVTLQTAGVEAAVRLGEPATEAAARVNLGTGYRLTGDYPAAVKELTEALTLHRAAGDRLGEANALACLGDAYRVSGRLQEAIRTAGEARELYEAVGDRLGRANALTCQGMARYVIDEYPEAAQALGEALELYRELDDPHGQADALRYLGDLRRLTGDYPGSVRDLRAALALYRERRDRLGEATALMYLGDVHGQAGDDLLATDSLGPALDLYRDLGDRLGRANALHSLSNIHQWKGDHDAALRTAQEALDLYRELGNRLGEAQAGKSVGKAWHGLAEPARATAVLREALDIARDVGDRSCEAEILNVVGAVHCGLGELVEARACHHEAVRLAQDIASHWDEAHGWTGLGRCEVTAGTVAGAREHLQRALDIFRRIGSREAAEVAAELAEL